MKLFRVLARMNFLPFLLFTPFAFAEEAMNFQALKEALAARMCEGIVLKSTPAKAPLVLIGLGNIGLEYEGTRHNVGRNMLQLIANSQGAEMPGSVEVTRSMSFATEEEAEAYFEYTGASRPERNGKSVRFYVGGEFFLLPKGHPWLTRGEVIIAFPGYDINESGYFVGELARELEIPTDNFVVFTDDINMQRNQILLSQGKTEPSAEAKPFKDVYGDGHNGLRSLNAHLGAANYHRLRFGVSSPRSEKIEMTLSDWVLGPVPEEDSAFFQSKASIINQVVGLLHEGRELDQNQRQRIVAEISRSIKAMKK